MNPEFYGLPADPDLTLSRFRKLLTKTSACSTGLPTSDDPASPMFNKILGPDDLDVMVNRQPYRGSSDAGRRRPGDHHGHRFVPCRMFVERRGATGAAAKPRRGKLRGDGEGHVRIR
jgi:hypothetical protein